MKTLKKINLKSVSAQLSNNELKRVYGGYGEGANVCAANKNWESYLAEFCTSSQSEAIAYAGDKGHWGCNSLWAIEQCG